MPTDHEQAPAAQIFKKYFDAQKSESFHPLPLGSHCAGEEGPETIIKSHSKMAQPFTANNPLFQFLRTLS